ncbi:hypothetical protein SeLEV6574_g00569 [Synchytrium endobioticum]|uniref:Uncharacterized protein n=1 Tax=Synchytrium endobioticum TaxID=286115 RepID=A0A507DH49_9FUNG|nr:hypothetical protein SeLEV6574_g00569 [Synchytrium endobioticum]
MAPFGFHLDSPTASNAASTKSVSREPRASLAAAPTIRSLSTGRNSTTISAAPSSMERIKPESENDSIYAIRSMVSQRWESEAIFSAVTMGLFDAFPAPPATATSEQISTQMNWDPLRCTRFLRALCAANVIKEEAPDNFMLLPTGDLLRRENPDSMADYIYFHNSQPIKALWNILPDVLDKKKSAGKCAMELVYKVADLSEYAAKKDKSFDNVILTHVNAVIRADNLAALRVYSFSKFNTITDLTPGDGRLICEIVQGSKNQNLKGLIHKQISTTRVKQDFSSPWPAKLNLESRVTTATADRFTGEGLQPSDCYIIRRIKVYSEQKMIECYKAVHKVAPPHAKLVVIGPLLPLPCEPDTNGIALFDMFQMMISSNSRTRPYCETKKMFASFGWKLTFVDENQGVSVLEFAKA